MLEWPFPVQLCLHAGPLFYRCFYAVFALCVLFEVFGGGACVKIRFHFSPLAFVVVLW